MLVEVFRIDKTGLNSAIVTIQMASNCTSLTLKKDQLIYVMVLEASTPVSLLKKTTS
jgi:hypothetical protein